MDWDIRIFGVITARIVCNLSLFLIFSRYDVVGDSACDSVQKFLGSVRSFVSIFLLSVLN